MKHMLLSVKLYGAFGIVLVLIGIMGLLAMSEMSGLHEHTVGLTHGVVPKIVVLGKLSNAVQSYRRHELVNLMPGSENLREQFQKDMAADLAEANGGIEYYGRVVAGESTEAKAAQKELEDSWRKYLDKAKEVEALRGSGDLAQAAVMAVGPEGELIRITVRLIDKQVALNDQAAGERSKSADSEYDAGRIKVLVVLLICIVAGLGLAWALIRNVLGMLGEDPGYLRTVAGAIAGGNLNVVFRPVRGQGGVYGVLVNMVKTLEEKIAEAETKSQQAAVEADNACKATLEAEQAKGQAEQARQQGMLHAAEQLVDVAQIISTASEELSAQVEQSSKGSEIQARRVGETATAMEQMNATVLEVAKNAAMAAQTSDEAKAKAEDGASVVGQVVQGISQVQKQTTELKDDMSKLGAQAEAIGRIMNVISDIADQTNLLALNAAIEAARAGEAGRGFAVVADEVRKLAEKTMAATKEVGEAISGIQDGTRRNIGNVDRAVDMITQANTLAAKSGQALGEIVTLVERTADQVRSIATSAEEQSASSEEINRAIEDINRVSSETSEAMTQSAQAVTELAEQALALKSLIENMQNSGGGGKGVSISAKDIRRGKGLPQKALPPVNPRALK
jgi:methyl-accepting chemotaxis protein